MPTPRTPLHPGTTVGGYVVEHQLGQGGMADVYLARDLAQQRLVALKVLPADAANDPRRRERLQHEGRVLQSLRHPNICSVYEVGEDGERTFIAMEYLEGRTLHEVALNQPLTIERVIEIGCLLTSALDVARHAGVVHRDLKGSNVMVLPSGEVKVLDFGLAKFAMTAEQRLMNPVRATDPGLIFGTAEFMSPEQALGREIDHRSDLFSLGVILYELLTNKLPFKGGTRMELFWSIMNAPPKPIAQLNPDVPPALAKIVERLLEKDVRARYQTAEKAHADLKELLPKPADNREARRVARLRWFHRLAGSALGIIFVVAMHPLLQAMSNWIDDSIENPSMLPGSVWSSTDALYDMKVVVDNAVSPAIDWVGDDGRILYTTSQSRGRSAVWLSMPGEKEPKLVVRDAGKAFVAPDQSTVYFVRSGEAPGLYRTTMTGASPEPIVRGDVERPVMSRDGRTIMFARPAEGGYTLWAVAASGGAPYQLSTLVSPAAPLVSPNHALQAIPQGDDVLVCDVPACGHQANLPVSTLLSWNPDSTALVHQGPPRLANIWLTRVADGTMQQVTRFADATATSIAWSTSGHRVAMTRRKTLSDVDWMGLLK